MLITINLLPWRTARQFRQLKFFYLTLISVIIAAAFITLAIYKFRNTEIIQQQLDNTTLQQEITLLTPVLEKIKTIQSDQQKIYSQLQQFYNWKNQNIAMIHVLEDLVQLMPEGIYLTTIKRQHQQLFLTGISLNNAQITQLMQSINHSTWLSQAILIEIKQSELDTTRLMFTLDVTIKNQQDKK